MADAGDPAAAAERLEAALARIAALSAARPSAAATPHDATAEVAARLDAVILQLRKLLQNLDN